MNIFLIQLYQICIIIIYNYYNVIILFIITQLLNIRFNYNKKYKF